MRSGLEKIRESLQAYLATPDDRPRTPDLFHYYSPEVYELELEYIWKKEWIAVGHTAWLKRPGDYFAWDIMGEPIVFVRGQDGQVRGLSSICRHRAVPVTEDGERGSVKRFQCPYHLWTYGLDGQLTGAPFMTDNAGFDKARISLPEFRVEVWNGIVFVNFDDDAAPLAPRLEGLATYFRFCDRDDLVCNNVWVDEWNTNWKQAMENGDVYHGPGVHPEAARVYDPLSMTQPTTCGEYWARQVLGLDLEYFTQKFGFEPNKDEIGMAGRERPAFEMTITPPANFLMPTPAMLSIQANWPISVDRTRVALFSVAPCEFAAAEYTPEQYADPEGPNRLNLQDSAVFDRGISRAVRSSRAEAGLMSPLQEGPAIATHRWLARRLLAAIDAAPDRTALPANRASKPLAKSPLRGEGP